MVLYRRGIIKALFTLRFLFFSLVPACIFAFKYEYTNLVYFISVMLLSISAITVKDVVVFEGVFQITKFYFFGFIKRKWHFNKDENIKFSTSGPGFGEQDGVFSYGGDEEYGIGCLLSLFTFFLPPTISNMDYRISTFDDDNNELKKVDIIIDLNEYMLMSAIAKKRG